MESFPHALEMMEGARRYISAFQAPLQELSTMSLVQIHTLRACSLLVIPPPEERVPLPGGFLMDLLDLNLLGWAALVQDVASGLLALPPNLGSDMSLTAIGLLQLLEKNNRMGILPLLLPPRLQVHLHGSLPTGSLPVVEPGSESVTWVWSDCLLWRHDLS